MNLNPTKCAFGVALGMFLGLMVSQKGIKAKPDKIKIIIDMDPPKSSKRFKSLYEELWLLEGSCLDQEIDVCPF